jgi:hypothetical protein
MTRFAEGDSQDTPVLVEGCLMEGFLVDGMDIKATNAPLVVRRSTFRRADPNNSNADAIDFGPGPGTVDRCLIHDFPDKGVSIGGAPGTSIRDTLIYRCGIGLSAYASSNVVFQNVTIVDCTTGILFRDNPTRAVGVATNLIVWGNVTNVSILNTSSLAMSFSDIDGTNYPGAGNISADPLFVDAASDDYRLSPTSPAKSAGAAGSDMGVRFPVGGIPSPPAVLVARLTSANHVHLTWQDTAENEDGVFVQRSIDGTNWTTIGSAPRNEVSFTDSTVFVGGRFYYRTRATNDVGVSDFSNRARADVLTQFTLRIERLGETNIVLSFEAIAGQSYTLQFRSSLTTGEWSKQIEFASRATTETIRLTNSLSAEDRYFQLKSP